MSFKAHVDVDSADSAAYIPWAQRQLNRLSKVRAFGKERLNLPDGTEVTLWWGGLVDKIRITSSKGFELLVLAGLRLEGLVFDAVTSLYKKDLNFTITSTEPPRPPTSQGFFIAEDAASTWVLGNVLFDEASVFFYRNKGTKVVGPFIAAANPALSASHPFSLDRLWHPLFNTFLANNKDVVTIGVTPDPTKEQFPSFDMTAYAARVAALYPDPFFPLNGSYASPTWAIVPSVSDPTTRELVLWSRTELNRVSAAYRLANYIERWSVDAQVVPLGSAVGTGLTLQSTTTFLEPVLQFNAVSRGLVAPSLVGPATTAQFILGSPITASVPAGHTDMTFFNPGVPPGPFNPTFSHTDVPTFVSQLTGFIGLPPLVTAFDATVYSTELMSVPAASISLDAITTIKAIDFFVNAGGLSGTRASSVKLFDTALYSYPIDAEPASGVALMFGYMASPVFIGSTEYVYLVTLKSGPAGINSFNWTARPDDASGNVFHGTGTGWNFTQQLIIDQYLFKNGIQVSHKSDTRVLTYSTFDQGSSSFVWTWDNLTPVKVSIPLEGISLGSGDNLIAATSELAFVNGSIIDGMIGTDFAQPSDFPSNVKFSLLYATILDGSGNELVSYKSTPGPFSVNGPMYVGKYKAKLFYVWETASGAFGAPVDDSTAIPVAMDSGDPAAITKQIGTK